MNGRALLALPVVAALAVACGRVPSSPTATPQLTGDAGESWNTWIENLVLHYRRTEPDPNADATTKLTRDFLIRSPTGQAGVRDMFFSMLDRPDVRFPIVTP